MNAEISTADQASLRRAAKDAIHEAAIPAFGSLADFLRNEYMQAATTTLGAEQLPDGQNYYAHQIQSYATLVGATSDEIHEIGLAEVARIKAEMDAVIESLEYSGSFDDFTHFLRTDPQFYAESAEQLLKEAAHVAKRIDYRMPAFFGTLPRQSYGIVPVPDELAPNYTTGAYVGAPIGGSRGGAYWVNTYALDQRPLYELREIIKTA